MNCRREPQVRSRDRGSTTVVAAVGVVALIATMVIGLRLGAAVLARHRAATAADLGALAGAAAQLRIGDGCPVAARLVGRNGAELISCSSDGADLLIQAAVLVGWGPVGARATARARAGPAG
jgi:secretion/DNA translocation related TadE-like protein